MSENSEYKAFARGKIKNNLELLVGDIVEFSMYDESYVIESVYPRKNSLIRPYVANIDMALITIAPIPKPDFILVDKILINCKSCGIKPVLCVNKADILNNELRNEIQSDYINVCDIIYVSALTEDGIGRLYDLLDSRVVCFCGQSAVGKSSVINRILPNVGQSVGGLSKKTERGKHTTRITEIFALNNGGYVVDTCGFTMLETIDINEKDLQLYYADFDESGDGCRYRGCSHIHEPDCKVKDSVACGKISKGRYDRYVQIFNEIKDTRRKKYE